MELFKLRYNLYKYFIKNNFYFKNTFNSLNLYKNLVYIIIIFFILIFLIGFEYINSFIIFFIIILIIFIYNIEIILIKLDNIINNKSFQIYYNYYNTLNKIFNINYDNINDIDGIINSPDSSSSITKIELTYGGVGYTPDRDYTITFPEEIKEKAQIRKIQAHHNVDTITPQLLAIISIKDAAKIDARNGSVLTNLEVIDLNNIAIKLFNSQIKNYDKSSDVESNINSYISNISNIINSNNYNEFVEAKNQYDTAETKFNTEQDKLDEIIKNINDKNNNYFNNLDYPHPPIEDTEDSRKFYYNLIYEASESRYTAEKDKIAKGKYYYELNQKIDNDKSNIITKIKELYTKKIREYDDAILERANADTDFYNLKGQSATANVKSLRNGSLSGEIYITNGGNNITSLDIIPTITLAGGSDAFTPPIAPATFKYYISSNLTTPNIKEYSLSYMNVYENIKRKIGYVDNVLNEDIEEHINLIKKENDLLKYIDDIYDKKYDFLKKFLILNKDKNEEIYNIFGNNSITNIIEKMNEKTILINLEILEKNKDDSSIKNIYSKFMNKLELKDLSFLENSNLNNNEKIQKSIDNFNLIFNYLIIINIIIFTILIHIFFIKLY